MKARLDNEDLLRWWR